MDRSPPDEWMTTADAISLLDAPSRECPSLAEASQAPFTFGLILVPILLVIAGIVGVLHGAWIILPLPEW